MMQRALIVDDEPDIRELLELTLGRMNIETDACADVRAAKAALTRQHFDLCLTDMRLPDGNGIEVVQHIQQHHPSTPVAVITAYGSMDTAVEALKAGAFDFVSKPVDLEMLRTLVSSALKLTQDKPRFDRRSRDQLLGDSPAMQRTRSLIAKVTRSQAPVYISGESGTGKELVAQLIHQKGPRAEKPFIPVNCGAIPTELMESEFFGHKKGSFTGAVSDKTGLFQAAQGGTLFLDEVAELPMHMQVKLLRAIQEKGVRPVGAQKEVPVDVRIVSATHKDLASLVQEDLFRQDLFYRINVINIHVPPLRDRTQDIGILSEHILRKISKMNNIAQPILDKEALDALQTYAFPGNVRELENILERASALCEHSCIRQHDLQLPQQQSASTPAPGNETVAQAQSSDQLESLLEEKQRSEILEALEKTRFNKTAAAKLLGITYRSLRYRIKKLGIE